MEPFDLLRHATQVVEAMGLRYFVSGSTATIFYGEPRFTNDIDMVVELSERQVADFCRRFPAEDFYLRAGSVVLGESRQLCLKAGLLDDCGVHDVVRKFAASGAQHALDHGPGRRLPDVGRGGQPVGRENHVVQPGQRIVRR